LKKRVIIIVFIILFVGVGLMVYIGQQANRSQELFYSGTIETTQANLSFQVAGRVAKVNVREGQVVTVDQVVAELDRPELESRYAQAQANLKRAQKGKQQAETILEVYKKTLPADVSKAIANVKSSKDSLKDAEKNYQRFEELFKKGVVTEKERDTLKLTYDVAKSKLTES
jgi:HlyD family secretion protein